MKKHLSFLGLFAALLFSFGCSEDQHPKSGNLELKLTFSVDLSDDSAPVIEFAFPGGYYNPSSGKTFTTDSYSVKSGDNILYQVTSFSIQDCTSLTVEAVYSGKVIQTDIFEFGENCNTSDTEGVQLRTKNIVIP